MSKETEIKHDQANESELADDTEPNEFIEIGGNNVQDIQEGNYIDTSEDIQEEKKIDSQKDIQDVIDTQEVNNQEDIQEENNLPTKKDIGENENNSDNNNYVNDSNYNEITGGKTSDILDDADKIPSHNEEEVQNFLQKIDDLDEEQITECLQDLPEKDLLDILKEIEQINYYILEENEVYKFILNEDERVQNFLDKVETDEDQTAQEALKLANLAKCYFARKKLENTEKEFELKKAQFTHEVQNLSFELKSVNMSWKDLKESKEVFDKNIRIGGRHPVTKKIILQKVAKFFDDRIRNKMALTNRYKIKIQSDIMERNKILSQIKAQEKRLASLDMTEFQEAQFEHKKSCKQLAIHKDQLGKFKVKFSPLQQSITEMKRALEKEQNEMEQMKSAVSKLEHLKGVMLTEKTRNDQKLIELKATMRKIKLDPRRHNLPEVIEYAAAKRENATLKRNINKWNKKVELVQQEKFLYLSTLSKKIM